MLASSNLNFYRPWGQIQFGDLNATVLERILIRVNWQAIFRNWRQFSVRNRLFWQISRNALKHCSPAECGSFEVSSAFAALLSDSPKKLDLRKTCLNSRKSIIHHAPLSLAAMHPQSVFSQSNIELWLDWHPSDLQLYAESCPSAPNVLDNLFFGCFQTEMWK